MRVAAFATGLLICGRAYGVAQSNSPVPVPGIPIQTWTVDVLRPPARDIYIRNDDTVDHLIVSLQIFSCENLKQVCQVYTPNVVLTAGKTVKAMRLGPDRTTLPWKYQYRFQTRPIRPEPPMTTTMMGPTTFTTFSRTGPMPYVGLGSVEDYRPRVAAPSGQANCSRNGQGVGPAGGKTVAMFFSGENPDLPTMVYIDLDPAGTPVLYTENRGFVRGMPGGKDAETLPAHTIISVRVQQNTAELINEGANKAAEYFTVAGPGIMNALSLGKPADIMARVLRECGAN